MRRPRSQLTLSRAVADGGRVRAARAPLYADARRAVRAGHDPLAITKVVVDLLQCIQAAFQCTFALLYQRIGEQTRVFCIDQQLRVVYSVYHPIISNADGRVASLNAGMCLN